MISDATKKQLRDYGIFFGIVTFMILVIVALTFPVKKTTGNMLKTYVESVLGEDYKVLSEENIDLIISSNAKCYNVQNTKQKNQDLKAIILRVTTYYGPLPAVFIINETNYDVDFVGFANLNSRVALQFSESETDTILNYWCKKIKFSFTGGKNEK